MDRSTFERKVAELKSGEFVTDPAFYAYGSDAICEIKTLADALWECCSKQAAQINLLQKKNLGLQKTNRELTNRVFEMTRKLNGVSSSPFDAQLGRDGE